jgi:hypothetical protein
MPGLKTPTVTLTAIGSERKIALNNIGIPAVLIFHGRNNASASEAINGPVREKYPSASSVLVATIMDLHIAPRLLRGVVEAFIRNAYEDACKKLPKDMAPRDYLVLLPDWDGKLTKHFGFKDTDHQAGVVVLDRQGNVIGVYQGKDLVVQTLALLKKAFTSPS